MLEEYDLKKVATFFVFVVVFILLVVGSIRGIVYYRKYQSVKNMLPNPNVTPVDEVTDLLNRVGKLMVLPKDETPSIRTISDLEKVKGQSFFANASLGDKLLVYEKNKKAILYNPTKNVIVEVGPVLLPTNTPEPQPTASVSATISPPTASPVPQKPTPTPEPT